MALRALLAGSALLAAACGGPSARGNGLTTSRSTPSISAPQATASAAPQLRFILGFTHGGVGWTLLRAESAIHTGDLKEVAALLAVAVPLTPPPASTPPLTCGPSGVMMLPPERLTPHWTIGLSGGATVKVVADVAPCGATSTSYATDEYASLNGRPTKAVGLVPRLLALSQALPLVRPLSVSPATPSPGGVIQVTGDGWVGGAVNVTVFWCHQLGAADCTVKPLATLTPDASGHIAWRGRMPTDLPAAGSGYSVSIEAKNGLLDFVLSDLAR